MVRHTYIVKNIYEDPILLEFTDGSNIRVRPGGVHVWQGPENNLNFLQEYVDEGQLEVSVFETDFTGFEVRPTLPLPKFDWQREGF